MVRGELLGGGFRHGGSIRDLLWLYIMYPRDMGRKANLMACYSISAIVDYEYISSIVVAVLSRGCLAQYLRKKG